MRGVLVALTLALGPLPSTLAQTPTGAITQVDARSEVAAALFAASATQAAAERAADATLKAQRTEIEGLRAQVSGGAAQLRVALTAAEEEYVAVLAARDRAYAQEIAVFRDAVEDVAKTPEGLAALASFNAGDEIRALAVLDDLRAARDAARKKRADIESAAEGRRIATLALEARNDGKLTTAQVINRFEEITNLDPVFADWIELGRLYRDAGRLPDALRAANAAADAATTDQDRAVAFTDMGDLQLAQGTLDAAAKSYMAAHPMMERLAHDEPSNDASQRNLSVSYINIGDVQVAKGDLPAALISYGKSLAIRERLAKADPSTAASKRDLAGVYNKIGDVQVVRGDLTTALINYRASLDTVEQMARVEPSNPGWQWDLSIAHEVIGDAQLAQGNSAAALSSYQESRSLREGLAIIDPGNTRWQRGLALSHARVGDAQRVQDELAAALASFREALAIAEHLAKVDPSNTAWRRDVLTMLNRIGDVQEKQGDTPAALLNYRASLAIAEQLAESESQRH